MGQSYMDAIAAVRLSGEKQKSPESYNNCFQCISLSLFPFSSTRERQNLERENPEFLDMFGRLTESGPPHPGRTKFGSIQSSDREKQHSTGLGSSTEKNI